MQVFVSWSGKRGKALAEAVSLWLKNVNHLLRPWMSEQIPPGSKWSEVIGSKLSDADVGVFCVTAENVDAPWLVFEAGALSSRLGERRVIPILLDLETADLAGPLAQFQSVLAQRRSDMSKLAGSLNDLLGSQSLDRDVVEKSFGREWRDFNRRVQRAADIPLESATLRSVVRALRKRGLPEPSDGRSLNFEGGFESHLLYEAAFAEAKKRLYIYGRKNRKVFDKEHDDFFARLEAKRAKGFDFRCLFLDPEAPADVLAEAHADVGFAEELRKCIRDATVRLRKHGVAPEEIAALYRSHRPHAVVVIDELVLFAPTGLDVDGNPRAMTKCPFKIVDASDPLGEEFIIDFLAVWSHAKRVTE